MIKEYLIYFFYVYYVLKVKIYQFGFVLLSWFRRSEIWLPNDRDSLLALATELSFARAFAIASAESISILLDLKSGVVLTKAWLLEVANESPIAAAVDCELAVIIFKGFLFKSANVLILGKLTE